MADVHGFCDERFQPLRDLLQADLACGVDEGAALAVAMHGEFVVDVWGGYADLAHTKPWQRDTVVRVCSTSKVIVTIATLMLWDRGLLDLDEPIATYWPEFGQHGKETITTRQVLAHNSGLPGFGQVLSVGDVREWDRVVGIIERAAVWYEPGTVSCYHAMTFGFILGELVRRIAGRSFVQFVADEITEPLDADFQYTVSEPRDLARLAELRLVLDSMPAAAPMGERVGAEIFGYIWDHLSSREALTIVDPGGSGITNARGLARIGSVMALGGSVNGRRYLSQRTVDEARREHSYAEDQVEGWVRRGLLFGLDSKEYPAPTPTTIHWGGLGGSWLTMDPSSGISCAYTPNRMLLGDAELLRQAEQWQVLMDVLPTLS